MIQWTGAPATDATNTSTDMDFEEVVTWTETEILGVDLDDDGEAPYQTFIDGWRFRFCHYQAHAWYGGRPTSLVPINNRPRRFEETGRSRRWTSGFV